MYIESVQLKNFRNYDSLELDLAQGTNIFYGNNAQGKTNLLEAVYMFSNGRSHRAHTDSELVSFGKMRYLLRLSFCDSQRSYDALMCGSKEGKKQIKMNNVPITKLSMLMSYLNTVMFTPEDLSLVKGSPSFRRRFTDEAISQIYPKYLASLIGYHKALAQKNSLLKELKYKGESNNAMLSVWNEQLADFGAQIYKSRKNFLNNLEKNAEPIHSDISGETLSVRYCPGIKLSESGDLKSEFYNALEANQKREIDLGSAQTGIQRDDFKVMINDSEARIFGSQGQQRTCVLSLKIAETEFIKSERGEYPVLLLDDIMSELDIHRRGYLWERITDKQVLLTCTDTDVIKDNSSIKLFNIKNGKIINQK